MGAGLKDVEAEERQEDLGRDIFVGLGKGVWRGWELWVVVVVGLEDLDLVRGSMRILHITCMGLRFVLFALGDGCWDGGWSLWGAGAL